MATNSGGSQEIGGRRYYISTHIVYNFYPTDFSRTFTPNAVITLHAIGADTIPESIDMDLVRFVNGSEISKSYFDEDYTERKENKLIKAAYVGDLNVHYVDVVVRVIYDKRTTYYLTAQKQFFTRLM